MVYRQEYDDLTLLGRDMDLEDALESIRWELAGNFFRINNAFCEDQYAVTADFFLRFPASGRYDSAVAPLVPLGNRAILLGYALDGTGTEIHEQTLRQFLTLRAAVKKAMKQLPPGP